MRTEFGEFGKDFYFIEGPEGEIGEIGEIEGPENNSNLPQILAEQEGNPVPQGLGVVYDNSNAQDIEREGVARGLVTAVFARVMRELNGEEDPNKDIYRGN